MGRAGLRATLARLLGRRLEQLDRISAVLSFTTKRFNPSMTSSDSEWCQARSNEAFM